jgi:glycine betaine/choline ABC-type transport system substrate-binding protein
LAAMREFTTRKDAYSKMQTVYNVRLRDAPTIVNSSAELFKLLDEKKVDLVATEAADGHLAGDRYLVLEDDRGVFQASLTGIVMRRDVLGRFPGLDAALKQLSGKITLSTIRQLSLEIDSKSRRPAEVAAEFLRAQGL